MQSGIHKDVEKTDPSVGLKGFQSGYFLRYDDREIQRLNSQHQVYKDAFDGSLLNSSISLPEEGRVLESAAGSGAWMLDFAKSYPHTSVQGIDIQPRLFPQTLPHNASLSVCSITKLPVDWAGTFDLIHQRLLCLALTAPEWQAALAEMFRVVKPGGWVQLEESSIDFSTAGPVTRRLAQTVNQLAQSRGIMSRCAEALPDLLRQAGFINVSSVNCEIGFGGWNGEKSRAATSIIRDSYRGNGLPFMNAGLVGSLEEWDELVDEAEKEWDVVTHPSQKGAYFPFFQFCAQKPL